MGKKCESVQNDCFIDMITKSAIYSPKILKGFGKNYSSLQK